MVAAGVGFPPFASNFLPFRTAPYVVTQYHLHALQTLAVSPATRTAELGTQGQDGTSCDYEGTAPYRPN